MLKRRIFYQHTFNLFSSFLRVSSINVKIMKPIYHCSSLGTIRFTRALYAVLANAADWRWNVTPLDENDPRYNEERSKVNYNQIMFYHRSCMFVNEIHSFRRTYEELNAYYQYVWPIVE